MFHMGTQFRSYVCCECHFILFFKALKHVYRFNFRHRSTRRLKLSFSLTKHTAAVRKHTLVQLWKVSKVLKYHIFTLFTKCTTKRKVHIKRYFRQGLYELRVLSVTGIPANLLEAAGHGQRLE